MADPTGLSSEGAGAGVAEVDACSLEIERKYDVIPAVICSMCCLFGIIYCFFGEGSCTLTDFNIKQAKMLIISKFKSHTPYIISLVLMFNLSTKPQHSRVVSAVSS